MRMQYVYKPIPLTQTGIFHGPIDVKTDRVLPRSGPETWTFRIRADLHRVNRHLRRAGNAAANMMIEVVEL